MKTTLRDRELAARPPKVILPPSMNLITSLQRVARKHHDVAHVFSPVIDFYLINEPKMVNEILFKKHMNFVKGDVLERGRKVFGEGLLTSEGQFHHSQKRLIQPAFYSSSLASYSKAMLDYTDKMLESWKDKRLLDIHKEMTHLTMAVMAKTLFDKDIYDSGEDIIDSLSDVVQYFDRLSGPFAWFLGRLPINGRFEASLRKIDKMIYETILDRRNSTEDRGDILSMLLRAKDSRNRELSDKQIRDETLILFAAGHETTANALSWTWYLLSQNHRVEKKLHDEIDLVLGRERRKPSTEDVPKLEYTKKVIMETLRLYPPAWVIIRQATRNVMIGEFEIPKGTKLLMSQYLLQRDPRYFQRPERFDPDRWTEEMISNLPSTAYFPFGGGPRSCVGEPFALMEGILVIARTASRWNLELLGRNDVEILPRTTLRPMKGILMRTISRD